MSWVKLDDSFFRHPKAIRAGRDARDLYLAGLCYCASNLTDGFIHGELVKTIASDAEVKKFLAAVERLVEVGLWERDGDGYRVHDYLEYNPTKEQALVTKEARAEAGRRGGLAKASKMLANSQQNPSKPIAKPKQNSGKSLPRTPTPINSPNGESPLDPPEAKPDKAFDLFMALCEETQTDPAEITGNARGRQLAVAKRLADSGVTSDEVRREVRWLSSMSWVHGIDMVLVESQRTKWITAGRGDSAQPNGRASPSNGRPRGMSIDEILAYGSEDSGGEERDSAHFVDAQGRVVERRDHPRENRGLPLGPR